MPMCYRACGDGPEPWHTTAMASSVRASCDGCGTVDVPVAAVRLQLGLGGDRQNMVDFFCPSCGASCSQLVGERGARLLCAAGVQVVSNTE